MKFKIKTPALTPHGGLQCTIHHPTSFVIAKAERKWLRSRARETGLSMSEILRQSVRFAREQETGRE